MRSILLCLIFCLPGITATLLAQEAELPEHVQAHTLTLERQTNRSNFELVWVPERQKAIALLKDGRKIIVLETDSSQLKELANVRRPKDLKARWIKAKPDLAYFSAAQQAYRFVYVKQQLKAGAVGAGYEPTGIHLHSLWIGLDGQARYSREELNQRVYFKAFFRWQDQVRLMGQNGRVFALYNVEDEQLVKQGEYSLPTGLGLPNATDWVVVGQQDDPYREVTFQAKARLYIEDEQFILLGFRVDQIQHRELVANFSLPATAAEPSKKKAIQNVALIFNPNKKTVQERIFLLPAMSEEASEYDDTEPAAAKQTPMWASTIVKGHLVRVLAKKEHYRLQVHDLANGQPKQDLRGSLSTRYGLTLSCTPVQYGYDAEVERPSTSKVSKHIESCILYLEHVAQQDGTATLLLSADKFTQYQHYPHWMHQHPGMRPITPMPPPPNPFGPNAEGLPMSPEPLVLANDDQFGPQDNIMLRIGLDTATWQRSCLPMQPIPMAMLYKILETQQKKLRSASALILNQPTLQGVLFHLPSKTAGKSRMVWYVNRPETD